MIELQPTASNINAAVAQLASSPRGKRVLAALADASKDLVHLDRANSEAFASLAIAFASHQFNGTLLDVLTPHREVKTGIPVHTTAPVPAFAPVHTFEVQVLDCTREQAEAVLRERLGHDEDLGFNYRLNW